MLKTGIPISENILDKIIVILITLVLSFFTLVFGELVPKRIALNNAEKVALELSGLVYIVAKVFKSVVALLLFQLIQF